MYKKLFNFPDEGKRETWISQLIERKGICFLWVSLLPWWGIAPQICISGITSLFPASKLLFPKVR